ncbi:MAG: Nramp family divalent metal transporter [Candidatus Omnitrophica bacterium]|nr:Nramp family divalent metal transporter [Candidatus Omnitrophota bacterium]
MNNEETLLHRSKLEQLGERPSVVVSAHAGFWKKLLAFLGPGLLIAVGYVDPGNWATNLSAGAKFGYSLLWIVLLSNFLAILFQFFSLKLGIVTGRDLAQSCRDHFSRPVTFALWILCEVAIAACDLAEVIGSAIALNLLFGLPLVLGIIFTGIDVLIILMLQSRGVRAFEALIAGLMAIIGISFFYELLIAHPGWGGVLAGFVPSARIVTEPGMLFIALGILGATVMPHNLYLHSSIVQTRAFKRDDEGRSFAIRFASIDILLSLCIAIFINAAILILSAAAFHGTGHQNIVDINDAYKLLSPMLGASFASVVFAVALLASGQSSTLTGTLAGQIVMEGFLDIRLQPWIRQLITRSVSIIPAILVAVVMGARGIGALLVLSQVVLSFQLGFAIVPLVFFTSDKKKMGRFVNPVWLQVVGWGSTAMIILLNLYLLCQAVGLCTVKS